MKRFSTPCSAFRPGLRRIDAGPAAHPLRVRPAPVSPACPCWSTAASSRSTPSPAPPCSCCRAASGSSRPTARPSSRVEWLLDVLFNPAVADDYQHFLIENPEVLALFGKEQGAQKRFSFSELRGGLAELERQMKLAEPVDEAVRPPFQREVATLYQRVVLYQRLKASVNLEDSPDLPRRGPAPEQMLPAGTAAFSAKAGRTALQRKGLQDGGGFRRPLPVHERLGLPAHHPARRRQSRPERVAEDRGRAGGHFPARRGQSRRHGLCRARPRLAAEAAARISTKSCRLYGTQLDRRFGPQLQKCRAEAVFNQAQPFYTEHGALCARLSAGGGLLAEMARRAAALGVLAAGARLRGEPPPASSRACGWRAGRR